MHQELKKNNYVLTYEKNQRNSIVHKKTDNTGQPFIDERMAHLESSLIKTNNTALAHAAATLSYFRGQKCNLQNISE